MLNQSEQVVALTYRTLLLKRPAYLSWSAYLSSGSIESYERGSYCVPYEIVVVVVVMIDDTIVVVVVGSSRSSSR
jgi:hypothetical protein